VTIELTLGAAVLGVVVSFAAGLARLSSRRMFRLLAGFYIEVFRGSSALVQLFSWYYVLPLLGVTLSALPTGVLALGLNVGAYGAEVVRGAIIAVDPRQREAAIVLGMSPGLAMRRIILPQAFYGMLPPFGNLAIELLKGTALVSLIGLTDLTFAGNQIVQLKYDLTTEVYLIILVAYLVLAQPLAFLTKWLERRYGSAVRNVAVL
jgi:polar amino acid transport system permease protein